MMNSTQAGFLPYRVESAQDARNSTAELRGDKRIENRGENNNPRVYDVALIRYLRQIEFEKEATWVA